MWSSTGNAVLRMGVFDANSRVRDGKDTAGHGQEGPSVSGIQWPSFWCMNPSGMSGGGTCTEIVSERCATCDLSLSTSSSSSWFLLIILSTLLDRPPASSSLTLCSRLSICSLVLCLMFRWASRSLALFRASWALLRCVTDRLPPRAPRRGISTG
jgi:hypothetical protein